MKILYLLFAVLFLAFLSQPGNAQPRCGSRGGYCRRGGCPFGHPSIGQQDCRPGQKCCRRRYGK